MKLFLRFILSLCFLLAGGYSPLDAHAVRDNIRHAPVRHFASANVQCISPLQAHTHLTIRSAPSAPEKETDKIDVAGEDEDDNEPTAKKHVARDNHIAAHLYARPPTWFFNSINIGLPTGKHPSYSSSDRCILFRVFRI